MSPGRGPVRCDEVCALLELLRELQLLENNLKTIHVLRYESKERRRRRIWGWRSCNEVCALLDLLGELQLLVNNLFRVHGFGLMVFIG
jgi:hypothetical protein